MGSFHCPAHTGTMASGYGLNGGPSRCYPFWQEVMACYVTNTTPYDNSGAKNCIFPLEDYMECLHHKKEKRRTAARGLPQEGDVITSRGHEDGEGDQKSGPARCACGREAFEHIRRMVEAKGPQ